MPRPISWKQNLALVWLSQFLSMAAFSSAYTFVPFYFKHIGVTADHLSWYVALFAAAGNCSFAIAAPIWGITADIYGRRLMLLRSNFGAALLIPMMGFITNPDLLIFHRLLIGALAGTVTAAQTLIISTTPQKNRTFSLGALASAIFSGMMIGQFLGGDIVNLIGFTGTFCASGTLLTISGLLVLLGVRESFVRPADSRAKLRAGLTPKVPHFGKVWWLLAVFVFMSMSREFDGPFVPLLIDRIAEDDRLALRWSGHISGYCSAAAIVSGLALSYFAGKKRLIVVLTVAIIAAGLLRIPQALASTFGALAFFRALMVLAAGGIEPLLQSWLAAITPENEHGRFFGWAACFKAIGWAVGSLTSGWMIHALNNNVRAAFVGAALILLGLAGLVQIVHRRVPPPENFRKRQTG